MRNQERHKVVHLDVVSDNITRRSHINKCENILTKSGCCPVGCGYRSSQIELREHMIVYHSKMELKKWCINRDYLRYQEGLLSKADFLKTIEENRDHEKRSYWREKWVKWRD
jgi:hypothetical protein